MEIKKYCGECNNCYRRRAFCRHYGVVLATLPLKDGEYTRTMFVRLKQCMADKTETIK